jgi:hypothetical protein
MKAAAIAATERGWHVFPVLPGAKKPAINGWPTRTVANPAAVAAGWPAGCNVGIACGPSRLVVVDLDNGKDLPPTWQEREGVHDGTDVFGALLHDHGTGWPVTYMVVTPSGGLHVYFDAAGHVGIRNSAGKLGPMIDVRADGGYVLAAGSVVDGRGYTVAYGTRDLHPAPLPAWLAGLLVDTPPPQRRVTAPPRPVRDGDRYTTAAVQAELFEVATAPNGARNDQLNRSAYALARFVADGRLEPAGVADALADAARTAGLNEREAARTIQSAFTARCT